MLGWVHSDESVSAQAGYTDAQQELIAAVPWEDDGRYLCAGRLCWVRAGFRACPACNTPVRIRYKVQANYMGDDGQSEELRRKFVLAGIDFTVNNRATLPLDGRKRVQERLRRQHRSSAVVSQNVNKVRQHQRNWHSSNLARTRGGNCGQTYDLRLPCSVPAWVPTHATAQPPNRYTPFFEWLFPLQMRFQEYIQHVTGHKPAAERWWPLIWKFGIDQYTVPFSCPALVHFEWTNVPDDVYVPPGGWADWL